MANRRPKTHPPRECTPAPWLPPTILGIKYYGRRGWHVQRLASHTRPSNVFEARCTAMDWRWFVSAVPQLTHAIIHGLITLNYIGKQTRGATEEHFTLHTENFDRIAGTTYKISIAALKPASCTTYETERRTTKQTRNTCTPSDVCSPNNNSVVLQKTNVTDG